MNMALIAQMFAELRSKEASRRTRSRHRMTRVHSVVSGW
jgi:hypothetical protein